MEESCRDIETLNPFSASLAIKVCFPENSFHFPFLELKYFSNIAGFPAAEGESVSNVSCLGRKDFGQSDLLTGRGVVFPMKDGGKYREVLGSSE